MVVNRKWPARPLQSRSDHATEVEITHCSPLGQGLQWFVSSH